MNTPEKLVRLSPEVYAALERQLLTPFIQTATTDLQAGFMLGQQSVLALLRNGYVIGS